MVCLRHRKSSLAATIFLIFALLAPPIHAQTAIPAATITGHVLDLQTGEPIAKASVSISGQAASVITGDDGGFTLADVAGGALELRVYTVGYGLLKKKVDLPPGATLTLDLRLGQEALRETQHDIQQITVTAKPFDPVVADAPSQYTLDNTELQNLSTVLANDPFRAIASLPGVAANQDFYADFAVRGSGPAHTGVYVDGVLVDHPTYSLEDSGNIGSLSVVNGDTVRSVSLLPGAFPANYMNRTGAVLDIATRDGARDRIATRVIADVLGVALTSEGPIGRGKRASWLVSGRQSYLGYLLDRLGVGGGLTLNYTDASGKLAYDLTSHHKLSLFSAYGVTGTSRNAINIASQSPSFFTHGAAQHGMDTLHWDWLLSPNTLSQAQFYWTRDHEYDTNPSSAVNLDTTTNVYGFHEEIAHQFGDWNKVEAGIETRSQSQQRASYTQWLYSKRLLSTTALIPFDAYSQSAIQTGAFFQDTTTLLNSRLTLSAGGRWDTFTPTSQSVWLPRASAMVRATPSTSVTLAYGQYAQNPTLLQLYGAFGTPTLRAERATHETFVVDQFFSERLRLHVEFYNRQEHEDINTQPAEFHLLANNTVAYPTLGPVLSNSLLAYARGFEISLQRRSANRLSGWIAYARSYSKYWQPATTLNFPGDYDQRDTFSAYAAYRITRTINVSANARYGSGLPIPGYFASSTLTVPGNPKSTTGVIYLLSQSRNALHEDAYQRDDIRINKVFTRKHFNLTLHGEIENLTAHANYKYYQFVYFSNISTTHEVQGTRDTSLPFLPAAGLTVEF